ncbi:hypothetical protein BMS3Abin04_01011 [bacterium BMS3Abin04]|nr:hypothetical protein BMS3Abin04_01011 [bacterium BMS3Abin04]
MATERVTIANEGGSKKVSVTDAGIKTLLDIAVVDSSGNQINSSSEEGQFPAGTGSNGSITLTNADTAYSIPASAPTENYVIVLYNGSDTDMYVGYENSNANGLLLPSGGRMSFDLGANQVVYAYCGSAGKILSYSLKKIK